MFQDEYTALMEQVLPDKALTDKIISLGNLGNLGNGEKSRGTAFIQRLRKPAFALAAVLVFVFGGIPTMASNLPLLYDLMYLASPSTAQFFMPVQMSCEDNGIRMEVVATYIHADTAEVYITLQDLTGDRVDATTDLYDSYSINRPYDYTGYCERVEYDEATKTATFLIRITQWGERNIAGDKITFSVRGFLSDKSKVEGVPIALDLAGIGEAESVRRVSGFSGGGSSEDFNELFRRDSADVLGEANLSIVPAEEFEIVAAGLIDGRLHVQLAVENHVEKDNHSDVELVNVNGDKLEADYSIVFVEYRDEDDRSSRVDYYNYVFEIPPEGLGDYRLYGSFFTSGSYTQGDWRVTFPLVKASVEP